MPRAYVIIVLFCTTDKIVSLAVCPVQDPIEFRNIILLSV